MTTRAPLLKIEDAVFSLDAAIHDAVRSGARLAALAARLRAFLPSGPAADLAAPLEALGAAVSDLATQSGDSIREQLMAYGVPSDDAACDECGALDFDTRDCRACAAVRSDGWRLARKRCGWNV